jgi:uncharacterized protein with PIN domain
MTQKEWTTGELQVIKQFATLGAPVIARLLERPLGQIENKAVELKVSLEATSDDVSLDGVVTRIIQRIVESPELSICPSCGKRLASMRETGMCRCCHLDQLIALRQEQLAEEIRLRKLTKLRQDKRRLRICEVCGMDFYPRAESTGARCADCGGSE